MGINWGRALMTGTSGALDSRRALEIAERLRIDADARDLASRQTLAGEAFGRQKSLLDRSEARDDRRYEQGRADRLTDLDASTRLSLENTAAGFGLEISPEMSVPEIRAVISGSVGESKQRELERQGAADIRAQESHESQQANARMTRSLNELNIRAAQAVSPEDRAAYDMASEYLRGAQKEITDIDKQIASMELLPGQMA